MFEVRNCLRKLPRSWWHKSSKQGNFSSHHLTFAMAQLEDVQVEALDSEVNHLHLIRAIGGCLPPTPKAPGHPGQNPSSTRSVCKDLAVELAWRELIRYLSNGLSYIYYSDADTDGRRGYRIITKGEAMQCLCLQAWVTQSEYYNQYWSTRYPFLSTHSTGLVLYKNL